MQILIMSKSRYSSLNPHSPHVPYSMSSLGIWHDTDEIDPDHIWIDFHFVYVHKSCSTKGSALHETERIEWMSMTLIAPISHLDKYDPFSISCYDIDLSSFDLIISLDDFESFRLEVLHRKFFSLISDATARRGHGFL